MKNSNHSNCFSKLNELNLMYSIWISTIFNQSNIKNAGSAGTGWVHLIQLLIFYSGPPDASGTSQSDMMPIPLHQTFRDRLRLKPRGCIKSLYFVTHDGLMGRSSTYYVHIHWILAYFMGRDLASIFSIIINMEWFLLFQFYKKKIW